MTEHLNTNWNTWQELQKTVRWILMNLTILDSLEKNKGKIADPEKTGIIK